VGFELCLVAMAALFAGPLTSISAMNLANYPLWMIIEHVHLLRRRLYEFNQEVVSLKAIIALKVYNLSFFLFRYARNQS